jgi:hypothetical protein
VPKPGLSRRTSRFAPPLHGFVAHDWTDPTKIALAWSSSQDNDLLVVPDTFQGIEEEPSGLAPGGYRRA